MEAKHTPGPWSVETANFGESYGGYWQINAEFDAVACNSGCMAGARSLEENMANAHLLASAPDLLDALTGLVDTLWLDGPGGADVVNEQALKAARAAIARARGEG